VKRILKNFIFSLSSLSKRNLKNLSRKGSNMQQPFAKRDTLLKSTSSDKTKALKEIAD